MDVHTVENFSSQLNFGGISPGFRIEKYIDLNIKDNPPAKVNFIVRGDIKKFIVKILKKIYF